MDTGQLITVYLTTALVAGLVATMVARAKHRHSGYWMLCFLFPPLILVLIFLPKGRNVHDPQRDPFTGKTEDDEDDDTKTVPIEPLM